MRLTIEEKIEEDLKHCSLNGVRYSDYVKEHYISKTDYENRLKADVVAMLDKIRAEILDCLKALDEIEKSGLNIYLPNEISGRRLTYQQCLEFIDKYKVEIKPQESEDN